MPLAQCRRLAAALLLASASPAISCDAITSCDECAGSTYYETECFWCADRCWALTDWYPSLCEDVSQCASDYSMSTCTGVCEADKVLPANFSVTTAQCLLGAANASYCESDNAAYTCAEAFGELGLTVSSKVDCNVTENSVSVLLHPARNAIVVAFRGTEFADWNNLVQDLSAITTVDIASSLSGWAPLPPGVDAGRVGAGFVSGYASLRDGLFAALQKALRQLEREASRREGGAARPLLAKPKLLLTGHSLGGALAQVAAADITFNQPNGSAVLAAVSSLGLWTFESPRPGDEAFAAFSAEYCFAGGDRWTVEDYFDPIPKLPAQSLGFAHPLPIALVGPRPGEVRQLTAQQDGVVRVSTAQSPFYYHAEATIMGILSAMPGAVKDAGGKPEQCAHI
jgi:hypothetical protein